MKYTIVGLGNPGVEYKNTRHNVGRSVVTLLADKHGLEFKENKVSKSEKSSGSIEGNSVVLLNPNTLMNKSGSAVAKVVKSVKAAKNLIVVYDDLDLPLGKLKISFGGGSGGHKGLESVMRSLKTKDFIRLRVGVSNVTPKGKLKKPKGEEKVVSFLLKPFTGNEVLWKKIQKNAARALELILAQGYVRAQNELNQKKKAK